ncbi:MAG: glutaredoxin family protein [Geodermatophilaceae bacterium]|nr:glutaredoxin family protein [Geodermatophilaceae bacterium]
MTRPRVRLYSRANCHLCEVARADVQRICGELAVQFDETDVDSDPVLRAEYGDRVPVIVVDDKEHGYFRVDEARLRAALR